MRIVTRCLHDGEPLRYKVDGEEVQMTDPKSQLHVGTPLVCIACLRNWKVAGILDSGLMLTELEAS